MKKKINLKAVALTLSRLKSEQRKAFHGLFKKSSSHSNDCFLSEQDLETLLNSKLLIKISYSFNGAEEDLKSWSKRGINSISFFDPNYPPLLREIPDPPLILFYKGTFIEELWQKPSVAIVGTRRSTRSSELQTQNLAQSIAERGNIIVSGLAEGIDKAAHIGALNSKVGKATIAVLGHGLTHLYPRSHIPLADRIIEDGGLLLSHFEPPLPPLAHHFLNRNRIIAGLSLATIVVQAGEQSGALSTARHALECGREVIAIPGEISNPQNTGSNKLIRDGATPLISTNEIFNLLPQLYKLPPITLTSIADTDSPLISLLTPGTPLDLGSIKLSPSERPIFERELLELELSERIERLPGNKILLRP